MPRDWSNWRNINEIERDNRKGTLIMLHNIIVKIKLRSHIFYRSALSWIDYKRYVFNLSSFQRVANRLSEPDKGALLIMSGRGMNIMWAQIWSILSLSFLARGCRVCVLTSRGSRHINRYFRLLKIEMVFYDDLKKTVPFKIPDSIKKALDKATRISDYRAITYKTIPAGEIALSTYTRYHGTGVIDLNKADVRNDLAEWINILCQAGTIAEYIYDRYNVRHLFMGEIFFEEYGAFYYTALPRNLNIIKFTGTVRDDAFILQHMVNTNDRKHHASLSQLNWERIKSQPFTQKEEGELAQNFQDRYSDKWHRSKRNNINTRIMTVEEARSLLNIKEGRKVAVIFSHILYDSLFFFGTDLFEDYAQCLVETVRIACQNADVDWLVKVHPSNLWRGELNTLLKGKYEEENLLYNACGKLPPHVRIVTADTGINPYTWFQLADFGITVRGTSGLEMAALGKTVITAGTGRYEGNGFTIDPKSKDEYRDTLWNIQKLPKPTTRQIDLAKRYAHAIFVLKPFTVISLRPKLRTGAKKVFASDDLIYLPVQFDTDELPDDLKRFSDWAFDPDNLELIDRWNR